MQVFGLFLELQNTKNILSENYTNKRLLKQLLNIA